jgi:hypothetical protein
LSRFEFEFGTFYCFTFILVSFRKSCLLVSWCACGRCSMACNNMDCGSSSRSGAEDRRWSGTYWVLGGWMIERLGDGFSLFVLKTGGDGFPQFDLKIGSSRFLRLGFKTDNYDLVIWVSKSPRQFLSLCLKIKRDTVCRLRHRTDRRMKTVRGTCQDLAVCFT